MKVRDYIRRFKKRISAVGITVSMIAASLSPGMVAQAANDPYAGTDFETYLIQQGFPESYKAELRVLHQKYPYWKFEAQNTGLDWNTAIAAESKLGMNLTESSRKSSWKSTQAGAYNWDTGEWAVLDSGGWVSASTDIIKYYMDPRNFLNETDVFQFLKQSYDASVQTNEGLQNVASGTFLAGTYQENGTKSYIDTLMQAAQASGVSPYTLASMIIVEQGANGVGNCISGNVSGYQGLYNYFNIGAYASGGLTAVQRGLWYAGGSGKGDTSYGRPWVTRSASIIGGAQYYGKNYVNVGQDTLYLKKFNVQGNNMYAHQYMTNIQGAAQEGKQTAKAYQSFSGNTSLVFKIPVYNNMPDTASVQPTGDGSPNYMLGSLLVDGQNLTPMFDKYTTEYTLSVGKDVETIQISATALDTKASISGSGSIALQFGENRISITVTAQNGTSRTYNLTVTKEAGEPGGGSQTPDEENPGGGSQPPDEENPDGGSQTPDEENPDGGSQPPDEENPGGGSQTPDEENPGGGSQTPDGENPDGGSQTPDEGDQTEQPKDPDGSINLIDVKGTVGESVSVETTVVIDTDDIASSSVQLTYDPSALELIESDNVTGGAGSATISDAISEQVAFKILEEGVHTVNVSSYEVKTYDEEVLVLTKGQAAVTGVMPANTDTGSEGNGSGSGDSDGDRITDTEENETLDSNKKQQDDGDGSRKTTPKKVVIVQPNVETVKTGDSTNPYIYIILLAGMAIIIGACVYKSAKRRKS